jgi:hypothetical protein
MRPRHKRNWLSIVWLGRIAVILSNDIKNVVIRIRIEVKPTQNEHNYTDGYHSNQSRRWGSQPEGWTKEGFHRGNIASGATTSLEFNNVFGISIAFAFYWNRIATFRTLEHLSNMLFPGEMNCSVTCTANFKHSHIFHEK